MSRNEVDRLLQVTLSHFKADPKKFWSGNRDYNVTDARNTFWIILRKGYKLKYKEIAAISGNDHTSVIYACRDARIKQLWPDIVAIRSELESVSARRAS